MRIYLTFMLTVLLMVSAQAVEQPNSNRDPSSYPVLTMEGLEDFQLGQVAPTSSSFAGLTAKAYSEDDWQNGKTVKQNFLKLYFNGFYTGRVMLDSQKRVLELEVVDWRVTYSAEFAAGSSWGHLRQSLPNVQLHYADMLESLVAESPDLPGLQVHFKTQDYGAQAQLQGDFTALNPGKLPSTAKAEKLRLFWVPNE